MPWHGFVTASRMKVMSPQVQLSRDSCKHPLFKACMSCRIQIYVNLQYVTQGWKLRLSGTDVLVMALDWDERMTGAMRALLQEKMLVGQVCF